MPFKRIGSAKAPNWAGIVGEIDKAFDTTVKKRLPEYAEKVVDNWDNRPKFPVEKETGADIISMKSAPSGPARLLWIYQVVGTGLHGPKGRKYPIVPKRARALVFPSVYIPKTTPKGDFGGPGTSSGPLVVTQKVMHPGIEKRPHVKLWGKEVKQWFPKTIREAVKRGVRKA